MPTAESIRSMTDCIGTSEFASASTVDSDHHFRFEISIVDYLVPTQLHSHALFKLGIVFGGRGLLCVECENCAMQEGELFVIDPGVRHGIHAPQRLRICEIIYDANHFLSGQPDLEAVLGFNYLFSSRPNVGGWYHSKRRMRLNPEAIAYVRTLTATLLGEYHGTELGRKTAIQNLFLILVTYLSRQYASSTRSASPPSFRMANVISYIHRHYAEDLRIDVLARLVHLSPSQFQRLFRKIYNVTPHQLLLQVRMRAACELLKDPNRDITQVAFDVGFNSSAFFSAQFKRYVGESPSSYRRRTVMQPELWNNNALPFASMNCAKS